MCGTPGATESSLGQHIASYWRSGEEYGRLISRRTHVRGRVTKVHIGQVIMSIHTTVQNKENVTEALHRAKFKFPGHHKIPISQKWDFTKFNTDEFEDMVAEKQHIPDGFRSKSDTNHGPLNKWQALYL
ncbi:60S ribosomal protein L10 [Galemys pyrenaicus]|uniref:60S ribosomal protein L10 n=1 Tax=Galemys pyrenaicus TaxID=202257 RepID=A0A8J6AT36_GALPY|nr:60S ribosomal protein L10 [Galemys pyrenaicus]